MRNAEVATVLEETADLLEMEEVPYKPVAYRRAANQVSALDEAIEDVQARGDLTSIPGIGDGIARDIATYLDDGSLEARDEIKRKVPVDMKALTRVDRIGPKRVKRLHDALGIRTLEDLEEAAREGKIADVEGFGDALQETILDSLGLARADQQRTLLGTALPLVQELTERLRATEAFETITPVGSIRRRRATVGDVDLLAQAPQPEHAMSRFVGMDAVDEILAHGVTRSSVRLDNGLQVDLRIVDADAYGAALVYFTGSKDHNIQLRKRAQKNELKLNEYGIFTPDGDRVAGATERDVYKALGMDPIPPELREATGEVQAAVDGKLPPLVTREDIRGDLHMHTRFSDGRATVQEMAHNADRLGHEYVLITDHGPASVVDGPTPDEIPRVIDEIRTANEDVDATVLAGIESNITPDGRLDLPHDVLDQLDLVVASLHEPTPDATERIVNALDKDPVDILAHPTNRRIGKRDPNPLEMDRIVDAAVDNHVAIEINSQPSRLDLPWRHAKHAVRGRVPLVVNTDSHSTEQMSNLHLGVAQARKAWLSPEHVLNTRPLDEVLDRLDA